MADKKPLRFLYSGTDTIGLSELQAGETIAVSDIGFISGTNIKTINSNAILGSGDITVQAVLVSGTNIKTINGSSILGSGDLTVSGGSGGSTGFEQTFLLMGA